MNRKTGILAGLLIVLCIAAGVFFHANKPETTAGAKEINVVVVHADQTENTFTYQTDAEYLADVLLENELVTGETGAYGLFITTVDGETADDSKQQTHGNHRPDNGREFPAQSQGIHAAAA